MDKLSINDVVTITGRFGGKQRLYCNDNFLLQNVDESKVVIHSRGFKHGDKVMLIAENISGDCGFALYHVLAARDHVGIVGVILSIPTYGGYHLKFDINPTKNEVVGFVGVEHEWVRLATEEEIAASAVKVEKIKKEREEEAKKSEEEKKKAEKMNALQQMTREQLLQEITLIIDVMQDKK